MKIGILFFLGLGNAVMFLPALTALRRAYPDASITLLIRDPLVSQLLSAYDDDLKFRMFKRSGRFVGRWFQRVRLLFAIRWMKFDVLLSTTHVLDRENRIVGLSKAKKKYGIQTGSEAHDLVFDAVAPASDMVHEVGRYNSLVSLAGVVSQPEMPALDISSDKRKAAEILIPRGDGDLNIAVHAGSGSALAYKRWGAQNFSDLIDSIDDRLNCHFYLFGGPDEVKLALEVADSARTSCTVLAGETDLMTTIACLDRCDLLISNDSGVSHLADTVSLRSVTLFGPTSEFKNRPQTEGSLIVRAESSICVPERENICDVCAPKYKANGETPECLRMLGVGQVTSAVVNLVQ